MAGLSTITAGSSAADRVTLRAKLRRSRTGNSSAEPVWVHRMHADGLDLMAESSWAPLQTGSQRFIERWSRVSCGY